MSQRNTLPHISNIYGTGSTDADNAHHSDNLSPAEDYASTELSLLLLDHGMSASEIGCVMAELAVLKADWQAGKMTDEHLDRVSEIILVTALARVQRAS